jgi:hypothetical protein
MDLRKKVDLAPPHQGPTTPAVRMVSRLRWWSPTALGLQTIFLPFCFQQDHKHAPQNSTCCLWASAYFQFLATAVVRTFSVLIIFFLNFDLCSSERYVEKRGLLRTLTYHGRISSPYLYCMIMVCMHTFTV